MKNAITKAIEGGWKVDHWDTNGDWYFPKHENLQLNTSKVLLSPLFWQALGKAMLWDKDKTFEEDGLTLISWRREWHKLIDHLAEGKDAESFFNKLLK